MKQFKKFLAIILAICTAFSAMAISASAEDTAEVADVITQTLVGVEATKFADGDTKKVLQIEMTFDLDNEDCEFIYNEFNENAEILISDCLLPFIWFMTGYGDDNEAEKKEVIERYVLAKAKPVSFEEGVLTLDVFSKDDTAGAILLAYSETKDRDVVDSFYFTIPEGLFTNSETEESNSAWVDYVAIKGLELIEIKLSAFSVKFIQFLSDSESVFVLLMLLPLTSIVIASMTIKYQKVYGFYNISVIDEAYEAYKTEVIRLIEKIR